MTLHKYFGSAAALALIIGSTGGAAAAQDVRIVGKDGSIDLRGELISAADGKLVLKTGIGEVTIDQSKVNCEGAACPAAQEFDYAFNLAGPGDVAEMLLPILFDGFATDNDAEVQLLDPTGYPIEENGAELALRGGTRLPMKMIDYEGEDVAVFGIQELPRAEAVGLLAAGEIAVAFTDSPLTTEDLQAVARAGAGNLASFEQEHVVAVDGLTVIVHPDNKLASVSVSELADVLGGRIANWSELGGADAPITLYSLPSGSDGLSDVQALVLAPTGQTLSATAKTMPTAREMTAAITSDPNGFGVVGYHSKRDARPVPLRNACGMVIAPSPFTIKTEEYPLGKRIAAYNRTDAEGLARDFLDHLDRSDLDGLVSKAGFIDLSVVPEGEDYAAARRMAADSAPVESGAEAMAATMKSEIGAATRLSSTFRFAPASSVLDNRARRDLQRVVSYVAREKPATLFIVGFADSAGPFADNQRLSEARAQVVAEQLAAAATGGELSGVRVEVRGFSELSPVACNEVFEGRAINRRVEIWTR